MAIKQENVDVDSLAITLHSLKSRVEMFRGFAEESEEKKEELVAALVAEGAEYPEEASLVSWYRGRAAAYRLAEESFQHVLRQLKIDLRVHESLDIGIPVNEKGLIIEDATE